MRTKYVLKLVFRCLVFIFGIVLLVGKDSFLQGTFLEHSFNVLDGFNFFKEFSIFHILWVIWVISMLQQIIPIKNRLPLGSAKNFANRFKTSNHDINWQGLRNYIKTVTRKAYLRVFLVWAIVTAIIGVLYYFGPIDNSWIILISIFFYLCDLICVVIWCPFRLLLGNRCCTTCRIFNWDHLMMFSPMIFVGGFFGTSLFLLAVAAFMVWEVYIMIYPERFWAQSNTCLKCSECTDKLCTQYCGRKKKHKTSKAQSEIK